MPELPEVETIRRDLELTLINRQFIAINIISPKSVKNETAFFISSLLGNQIVEIKRYGKLLVFKLKKNNLFLLVHLKMTGQLILEGSKKRLAGGHSLSTDSYEQAVGGPLPNKHTRASFSFKGNYTLFFNDLRKFGYLKLVDQVSLEKIISNNYGPEPSSPGLNKTYLYHIFQKRHASVKSLLLNQKIVAGLGNIYVDEALFAAGIRPTRPGNLIKLTELTTLVKEINLVIARAIKNRGTTFSDYRDSSGKKGNFSQLLKVYGRQTQPCIFCKKPLVKEKVAGRGTHYCSFCQK